MRPLQRLSTLSLAFRPFTEPQALARWRDARVRDLIDHGSRTVPFVRAVLERAGLAASDVRTAADLAAIEPIARRTMQDAGLDALLSCTADRARLLDRSTSGSTGERMVVRRTWFEERLLTAFLWRALREYGLRPGERVAVALFHARPDPRDDQRLARLVQWLGFRQARILDALGDPEAAASAAAFDPQALMGMTGALARLIESAAAGGQELRPRFVMTWGELLTDPLRHRIGSLGVPIHDVYGSNEVGLIAWECPAGAGGYHVADDLHVVDIVAPDGRPAAVGAWGEVVVTALHSLAMPFVRYRVGDRAQRGPAVCPCGAPYSTLTAIQGRTIDDFALPDGRLLHPWELLNALRPHTGWVRQFQLVQVAPGSIVLRAVAVDRPPSPDDLACAETAACEVLRGAASFRIDLVPAIADAPSGKSRPFVPFADGTT